MREGEGYKVRSDGVLAFMLGGLPVVEIPADGELHVLVEERDVYHDVVHAHGDEDVVERRRAGVIGRGSTRGGRNALSLHVLRLQVSQLDAARLAAINERIAGKGTGLLREVCDPGDKPTPVPS